MGLPMQQESYPRKESIKIKAFLFLESLHFECSGTAWHASLLQLPTKEKETVGKAALSQAVR